MKIVLAEDRGGKLLGERAFTSEVVLVGRDPAVCHFFFSQDQWPMVSRRHAEFRFVEGRCLVADVKSRFGTYADGQKVSAPVEVRVGSHVQLGVEGPILRVVSIEQAPVEKVVEAKPAAELDRLATAIADTTRFVRSSGISRSVVAASEAVRVEQGRHATRSRSRR